MSSSYILTKDPRRRPAPTPTHPVASSQTSRATTIYYNPFNATQPFVDFLWSGIPMPPHLIPARETRPLPSRAQRPVAPQPGSTPGAGTNPTRVNPSETAPSESVALSAKNAKPQAASGGVNARGERRQSLSTTQPPPLPTTPGVESPSPVPFIDLTVDSDEEENVRTSTSRNANSNSKRKSVDGGKPLSKTSGLRPPRTTAGKPPNTTEKPSKISGSGGSNLKRKQSNAGEGEVETKKQKSKVVTPKAPTEPKIPVASQAAPPPSTAPPPFDVNRAANLLLTLPQLKNSAVYKYAAKLHTLALLPTDILFIDPRDAHNYIVVLGFGSAKPSDLSPPEVAVINASMAPFTLVQDDATVRRRIVWMWRRVRTEEHKIGSDWDVWGWERNYPDPIVESEEEIVRQGEVRAEIELARREGRGVDYEKMFAGL